MISICVFILDLLIFFGVISSNIEKIDINQIHCNLDEVGNIGVPKSGYDFNYSGSSLLLNPDNNQTKMKFMIGFDSDVIDDFSDISTPSNYKTPTFQEIINNYQKDGIEIKQKSYGWNETGHDKYIIIEYQIKNVTGSDINELYAGIYADWNIGAYQENKADWQGDLKLAYTYPTSFLERKYVGVALITENPANYYAFDNDGNDGSINIDDGFSNTEKLQSLSDGISRSQAGISGSGNDVSFSLSGTILGLKNNTTQTIAFAIVVGDDFDEIQELTNNAKARFKEIKTGPLPELDDVYVCNSGESGIIQPTGGSLFRFYDTPPTQAVNTPIFEGNQLPINNITTQKVYYVTNIDSLYESNPVEVKVGITNHTSEIITEGQYICPNQSLTLEALEYPDAVYRWFINGQSIGISRSFLETGVEGDYQLAVTKNGCTYYSEMLTIIQEERLPEINKDGENLLHSSMEGISYQWYLNGFLLSTAKEKSYLVNFPGRYEVEVTLDNGCVVRSEPFDILIITNLEDTFYSSLETYPNPCDKHFFIKNKNQSLPSPVEITMFDIKGSSVWKGEIDVLEKIIVNTNHLPSGIYTISFEGSYFSFRKKILVNH